MQVPAEMPCKPAHPRNGIQPAAVPEFRYLASTHLLQTLLYPFHSSSIDISLCDASFSRAYVGVEGLSLSNHSIDKLEGVLPFIFSDASMVFPYTPSITAV